MFASPLTRGGLSGANASTMANLTNQISVANKAYTTSLSQLKTLQTAARDARSKVIQVLKAHSGFDVHLECVGK